MGSFGGATTATMNVPSWGLAMLYYSSWSGGPGHAPIEGTEVPGILTPNYQGIALMYSTQPGALNMSEFSSGDWDSKGLLWEWPKYLTVGYCYWVDRGTGGPTQKATGGISYSTGPTGSGLTNYSPAYDFWALNGGKALTHSWFYSAQNHMPAEDQLSSPGSVLCTDLAVVSSAIPPYEGLFATKGSGSGTGLPIDNHVDTPNNNWLPDGIHDLYNDGSVVWDPMSEAKVHYAYGSTLSNYVW